MVNGFHTKLFNYALQKISRRNISCLTRNKYTPQYCLNRNYSLNLRLLSISSSLQTALLSPHDVDVILREKEFTKEFTDGPVKAYDSNQLASNNPIEDKRLEALCKQTNGLLMGVFDGHGGAACAQVASKRLFNYIAASLLPHDVLVELTQTNVKLLETYNDNSEIVTDIKQIYENSFKLYLEDLIKITKERQLTVEEAFDRAITRLDEDFSKEALTPFHESGQINKKLLSVALSGAVLCVTHIAGPDVHIANVGDCSAVIGTLSDNNDWTSKKLINEHTAENFREMERIWSEHPVQEKKTVVRRNRLLGELAPLRAIGDYRYKWPIDVLSNMVVPIVGQYAIPPNYHTPPYLTSKPDVFYHRLTPNDKFLILASDGLWDMVTPLQAVKLVGEHMVGKVFFTPLKLPRKNLHLGDINVLLSHRKENLKSKPKDKNAATHLLRHAIGGTEYGVDHSRLSHLLSLPPDVSRMFRDDITITVIYFDSEFVRHCPT